MRSGDKERISRHAVTAGRAEDKCSLTRTSLSRLAASTAWGQMTPDETKELEETLLGATESYEIPEYSSWNLSAEKLAAARATLVEIGATTEEFLQSLSVRASNPSSCTANTLVRVIKP